MASKRPPKERIQQVAKEWVGDFIDFYGLEGKITKRQIEGWSLALARFNDETLKEGWDDFIMPFRPGFVPPIEEANRIFRRANLRVVERREAEERKQRAIEERKLFEGAVGEKKRIAQAVGKALAIGEESESPRADVNAYLVDFWEREMKDEEMGRKHRILAKGGRVVIHDPNQRT
jgi:hypothetical protein